MAKNVEKVARLLDARVVASLPETGGGAFGAARLARLVSTLQGRRTPRRKRPHGKGNS
jgi:hypothetical protein